MKPVKVSNQSKLLIKRTPLIYINIPKYISKSTIDYSMFNLHNIIVFMLNITKASLKINYYKYNQSGKLNEES